MQDGRAAIDEQGFAAEPDEIAGVGLAGHGQCRANAEKEDFDGFGHGGEAESIGVIIVTGEFNHLLICSLVHLPIVGAAIIIGRDTIIIARTSETPMSLGIQIYWEDCFLVI